MEKTITMLRDAGIGILIKAFLFVLLLLNATSIQAQRLQQPLGRGVVAVYGTSNGKASVEITWRRLAQEPENAKYNVYVSTTADGNYELLNDNPLSNTNYATTLQRVPYGSFVAVSLVNVEGDVPSNEGEANASLTPQQLKLSKPFLFNDNGLRNVYMEISYDKSPLKKENYTTKFVWPCDLNGDGEYDYVVDRCPVDGTLNYFVEGYLADGTFLWNIDLGVNETPCDGQNDNMCAYDIDCDGLGELIVQTSDGSRFWDKDAGTWGYYLFGKETGDSDGDGIIDYNPEKTKNPPRYMTVVNGMTGAEKASVEFLYDEAYNRTNKASLMGDEYNKHEAHVGIAYLDGIHPALVGEWHSRSADGKTHFYRNCAFAYNNEKQWQQLFMKKTGGEVFHQIRIADVDGDGKDEMLSGAYAMNNDGSTLYDTGISHGDRHRTADIDPEHPGLETFSIQQNAPDMLGMILFDAATGSALKKWYLPAVGDVGRGECMDLDPAHKGWEMFSTMNSYQMYDAKGNKIEGKYGYFPTEGIWWDGQLDRERVDSPDGAGYSAMIVDYTKGRLIEMAKESGWTIKSSNAKRGKFWGDIIGDWREELILIRERNGVCEGIIGFTTDYSTDINNIYCLQQDSHYRGDCTTRGYYQSPNPGFYLGYDMPRPQLPPCMVADAITDVFGIADGNADISPRTETTTVYAMPVKGQTLSLSYQPTSHISTIWKGQQGTLKLHALQTPLFKTEGKVIITEGTVELEGTIHGTVDLRARGTLAGNGSVDSICVEGALNYEGCRIKPDELIAVAGNLEIDKKVYVEITHLGVDMLEVKGALSLLDELVFTIGSEPSVGSFPLLRYGSLGSLSSLSTRGLEDWEHEIVQGEGNTLLLVVKGRKSQRTTPAQVLWTGAVNNRWDYANRNFSLNGDETVFVDGDDVVFTDKAANTAIEVEQTMPVTSATFSNDKLEYAIQGKGGINVTGDISIDGKAMVTLQSKVVCGGTLRKTGTGQLNISYAGANSWDETILSAGTLAMGAWNTTIGKATSQIHVTNATTTSANLVPTSRTAQESTPPTFIVFNNNSTSQIPTVQNTFLIDKGATLTVHAGKRCAIKGALKGEGTYIIDFPYVRGDVYTNLSQFEGVYEVASDNCRFVQSMNLQKGTLKLNKGAVVLSMNAGSGTEQNLTHKIGVLTGCGTLGNGSWQVSQIRYSEAPITINGNLTLMSATIDVTALWQKELADDAELKVFNSSKTVAVSGNITILPETPKEGFVWDTSALASQGILRLAPHPSGIETVTSDNTNSTTVYDLQGRRVNHPTEGIYIMNGKKIKVSSINSHRKK